MEEKLNKLYDLVETTYIGLSGEIRGLKDDVKELRQDVRILKADVSVLKQDVALLKQDVAILKQDVQSLDQRMTKLEIQQEKTNEKIQLLVEIQQSHYEENNREHREMLDQLTLIDKKVAENTVDIYGIKQLKKEKDSMKRAR